MTERYWRVNDSTLSRYDVTLGLQIANEDVSHAIIPTIKQELWAIVRDASHNLDDFERVAYSVEQAVKTRWPGRYYFIEVGNENDYWVQVFHPMTEFRKSFDANR